MNNMVKVDLQEWEALVELRARIGIIDRMYRENGYVTTADLKSVFGFDWDIPTPAFFKKEVDE